MKLLKLGHDLICHYKMLLRQNDTVSASDLRLAVYAIESALLHREAFFKNNQSPVHHLAQELLDALSRLKVRTDEFEAMSHWESHLGESLSQTIEKLSQYLEHDGSRTVCPLTRSDDAMEIPLTILNRLTRTS